MSKGERVETTNVTPIQNKVVQALEEIRDENDRLRQENRMLRAQVEEIAAIAVRQAIAVREAVDASDAGA